jgi:hypothetical protein
VPLITKPIEQRAGYREVAEPDEFQRDLAALAEKHGLMGCLLIQFDRERVGARSWGINEQICAAMDTLGTRILTDIDDGRHDPLEQMETEGRG